jgi:ribosomal-protein-serine acetyltransferase
MKPYNHKTVKPFLTIDEDLMLHQPQIDFAAELFAIVDGNRTYLEKWLPWVRATKTVEDSLRFLKDARRFSEGGQQLHTLIIYKGKIVGLVGFNAIQKKHQKGEIGYWIAENRQGKGIVTKAVKRLIDYGFKHLNLNRIIIQVSTQNLKSQYIPERLGFVYEGTLRAELIVNDEFIDMKIYSLLKSEYV